MDEGAAREPEVFADRYEILEAIGSGGLAIVQKARDRELDSIVALKRLLKNTLTDEDIVRFQNEARIAAQLRHKNIVEIHNFGMSDDDEPYLVMEYLPGKTLRRLIDEGSLSEGEIVEIVCRICEGLSYAHAIGIVHLDLTPRNVIVSGSGDDLSVKVIDFSTHFLKKKDTGDFTIKVSGVVAGTPAYMSPEQCSGEDLTQSSDIYALGCIIFEMVSGQQPFSAESVAQLCHKHVNEPVPVLETDTGISMFNEIVATSMSKSPSDRFASMHAIQKELESLLLSSESEKGEEVEDAQVEDREHSIPLTVLFSLVVVVAILIAGGYSLLSGVREEGAPSEEPASSRMPVAELIRRARVARGKKKYERALRYATQALEQEPDSYEAYMVRASVYQKSKQYAIALDEYLSANKQRPADFGSIDGVCRALGKLKKPLEAIRFLNEKINLNPDDSRLYEARADFYYNLDRFDQSLEDCNRAVELAPKDKGLYIFRAEIKRRLGNLTDAVKDITYAAKLGRLTTYELQTRAVIHMDLGQVRRARRDVDRALELDPDSRQLLNCSGVIWHRMRRPDLAEKDYLRAIELAPRFTTAHLNLFRLKLADNQTDVAALHLLRGYKTNPNDPVIREIADELIEDGDRLFIPGNIDPIIARESRYLKKHEKDSHVYLSRAVHYIQILDFENALFDLRACMAHSSKYDRLHLFAAQLCAVLAKRTGDREMFEEIIKFYSEDPKVSPSNREILQFIAGQCESVEALKSPRVTIETVRAQCVLGMAFSSEGKLDEAIELLIIPSYAKVDSIAERLADAELYRLFKKKYESK